MSLLIETLTALETKSFEYINQNISLLDAFHVQDIKNAILKIENDNKGWIKYHNDIINELKEEPKHQDYLSSLDALNYHKKQKENFKYIINKIQ